MTATYQIQYLPHRNIDKNKWDACIDESPNGLVYGYSFYLDHMAKHWDALVLNDYEAVMPLTWNKKFGIYYLYQPFLAASLGIFGKQVTEELVNSFLQGIPKKFRYWDIYLNASNLFTLTDFRLYERTNYILDLNKPYPDLFNNFRPGYRQLLKKDAPVLSIKKNIPVEDILMLAGKKLGAVSATKEADYQNFRQLYHVLAKMGKAGNYGAYTAGNDLIASAIFLFSHNRAYYILAGNDPAGRSSSASHHVIDRFIKDNAGTQLLLDFEGSDIENIAFFFKGFAAREEKYAAIKYNRLPLLLRWLKK
jgi:hypothetical protein